MKGFLCNTTTKTNEEYKGVLKSRMRIAVLLIIIGIITFIVSILAETVLKVNINSHSLNFYRGIGFGLLGGGIAFFLKCYRIFSSEERLKKSRIQDSDERILEISRKARAAAGVILLICLYVIGLIGGLFYPVLFQALSVLVCIYLVSYVIVYKIYDRKL